jgi:hypothetical protein
MKDWVRPYLIQELEESFDEAEIMYEAERKKLIESQVEGFQSDEAVFYALVEEFNTDFGIGILGGAKDRFTNIFGSVLADLPENVFMKLKEMKNLLFCFTPTLGGEVKQFRLEHDLEAGELLQVVTFPYENVFMPLRAARGEIVHELAHVWAEHMPSLEHEKLEEEADNLPREWGFEKEIEALREYEKEH